MRKRHGWMGMVLVVALSVAMAGILFPEAASADKHTKNVQSLFSVTISGSVTTYVKWENDERGVNDPGVHSGAAVARPPYDATGLGATPANEKRRNLSWTAFRSGLRFAITGPEVLWGAKSSGAISWDFTAAGSGFTGNHGLALAEAYMRFDYPTHRVIIGQTFMLFAAGPGSSSPVTGPITGISAMAGTAARPVQIQVASQPIPLGIPDTTLVVAGAVQADNTGRDGTAAFIDSGTRSAKPALNAQVNLASTALFKRLTNVVASVFYGEETLTAGAPSVGEKDAKNRGVSVKAILPLGPATPFGSYDVRGGWHYTENMQRWQHGLNCGLVGINSATCASTAAVVGPAAGDPDEISNQGVWVELFGAITRNLSAGTGWGKTWDNDDQLAVSAAILPSVYSEDLSRTYAYVRWVDGPVDLGLQYTYYEQTFNGYTAATPERTGNSSAVHVLVRYNF